jgi:hypothetical protein
MHQAVSIGHGLSLSRQAKKNKDQDISGYKFSPKPGFEFGPKGPFGLLNGVAISNYPNNHYYSDKRRL